MSERPTHEWRWEIGKHGGNCRVFLNGEAIYPSSADLHMAVNELSEVVLRFPIYGQHQFADVEQRFIRLGDSFDAEGTVGRIFVEIGDTRYQLIKVKEGDFDEGLFGERRINGAFHQEL